jgi:flagellar basal-body rod protein FlgB
MDPTGIGLFDLADKRLAWVDQRQALLAQNIANANTPGWRPRDVAPFASVLKGAAVGLAQTDPKHLTGSTSGIVTDETGRAPDGNGVALDRELSKVADTDATHELVTGLYRKYLAFFQTAMGR